MTKLERLRKDYVAAHAAYHIAYHSKVDKVTYDDAHAAADDAYDKWQDELKRIEV